MRNMVRVEQIQKIRKAFVFLDTEQIRGAPDAQRSKIGERDAVLQTDVNLGEFGDNPGITDAHEASDAPFPAEL